MTYRSSQIRLTAGQMFWREAGSRSNPVLIFLHGSWHDSRQWLEMIEPLSQHYHCFALDLLGYGNSIAIDQPSSIDIEVDCLHEFIDALKLNSVYLIGHSLGAWIGISYTLKYPDLVRGVVAISPEGFSLNTWNKYNKLTQYILAKPWRLKLWLAVLKIIASLSDDAIPIEQIQRYWQFFQQFPTTCRMIFNRSKKVVTRELVTSNLAQFRSPLSILESDKSDATIIEQSQAYARTVRKSEYHLISDLNPSAPEELDRQIVQQIKLFITEVQMQIDREEVELW